MRSIAFALALAACSPSSPKPPETITLTLGAPATEDGGTLAPLVAGQDVSLVPGAQGGFHVWLLYRLANAPRATVTLDKLAYRVSDHTPVLVEHDHLDLAPDASGNYEPTDPLRMFMCPTPIGVNVVGEQISFELRVSNTTGVIADQSIVLVPQCPTDDLAVCTRICTG